MALRTAKRSTTYIIGSATADATLTADFADNTISFPSEMYAGMKLYIAYTPDQNARNCTIQVEFGPEVNDFYIDSVESQTGTGEANILNWLGTVEGASAGTTYKRTYRVPVDSRYIRVSVKEDGGANFGAVTIKGEFKI